jgi:PKD repeat protein
MVYIAAGQSKLFLGRSYTWDFGDGNLSSDKNPYHEYAGPDAIHFN